MDRVLLWRTALVEHIPLFMRVGYVEAAGLRILFIDDGGESWGGGLGLRLLLTFDLWGS